MGLQLRRSSSENISASSELAPHVEPQTACCCLQAACELPLSVSPSGGRTTPCSGGLRLIRRGSQGPRRA